MDWFFNISGDNLRAISTLIVSAIVALIAYCFQKANYKLAHEKMENELFRDFNGRYDFLNDSLSKLAEITSIEQLTSTPSLIKNKTMHNVVIDYFNLCAEQYYWKEKGRISNEIWKAWHKGMKYYYNSYPVIKELWDEETKDKIINHTI